VGASEFVAEKKKVEKFVLLLLLVSWKRNKPISGVCRSTQLTAA
jgi:gamma-glutamyl-gamma-aminobutyrate hydrolase PuuD